MRSHQDDDFSPGIALADCRFGGKPALGDLFANALDRGFASLPGLL
jgi:hypothetical protein